jgi:4-amino-4-deoxy-L-arabinose transferase-like glycosyltransferase
VSRRWVWVAVVAVTVLGGALRARPALDPNPRQSRDEHGYVSVAIGLADTGRYGRQSLHWPPGAPVAFAAAARLDGHVVRGAVPDIPAAYWVQWAAGTALIPLVFALAATLGGMWAGLVAALVVATYPPLIAVTGDLLSEPLGALWLTAALLAVTRRRYALGGPLLAAAVLTRANLLVLIPVVAILLGRRHGAVFAVAAIVPVGLWSLNVSAPVSTGGGSAFFVGTFLPGDGTLGGTKKALKAETLRGQPKWRGTHAKDLPGDVVLDTVAARHPGMDRDAALRAEAWRNLETYPREDPSGYATMVATKLPRLWLRPSPRSDGLRTTPLRIWHALIVLAAFAGLLLARNRLVLGSLLAFTLFHLVVEAIPRYALPALPVLIAAGTAGWFSWLAARRARRTRPGPPDWRASPAPPLDRAASPSGSV